MLKIGFLVPDEDGSELSFVRFFPDFLAADLTEGSCPREKRSEVALGMFASEEAEAIDGLENSLNPAAKLGNQSYQITFSNRTRQSWASS